MAAAADFGLMIWDGKSPGTVLNALRLIRVGKAVVLVHGSATPSTPKSARNWETFLDGCSDELRTERTARPRYSRRMAAKLHQSAARPVYRNTHCLARGRAGDRTLSR
jgi:hypothetical protein